jgi:hypothetical protein
MTRIVAASVEIDAPAAHVWAVLADLPRYPEWNPFTPEVSSTLRVGDPLRVTVRLGGGTRAQQGRVTEHVPGQRVCWRIDLISPILLRADRSQAVEAIGERRCRYVTREQFSGALAGLVIRTQAAVLRRGFEALAAALKSRAEPA